MAVTYKGVNATNLAAAIPKLSEEGQYGGKVRQLYDTFTLTADLAASDVIVMGGYIPEGARVIDCRLSYGAMGGSCTVDVGWFASTELEPSGTAQLELINKTGFFSALPVSSAGTALAHGSTYDGTSFFQKVFAAQVQPAIWEHAVSSGATGKIFQIEILYIVD